MVCSAFGSGRATKVDRTMAKIETRPFDAAKYITEPEDVIDFLNDALETGHAPHIAAVLGDVARSEGMTKLAKATGINRRHRANMSLQNK